MGEVETESRGYAAVEILMTLHKKRAIASTVGSLLRRELSTGLRDGDGSGPQGLTRSRPSSFACKLIQEVNRFIDKYTDISYNTYGKQWR
jgi:hypothetical protein